MLVSFERNSIIALCQLGANCKVIIINAAIVPKEFHYSTVSTMGQIAKRSLVMLLYFQRNSFIALCQLGANCKAFISNAYIFPKEFPYKRCVNCWPIAKLSLVMPLSFKRNSLIGAVSTRVQFQSFH